MLASELPTDEIWKNLTIFLASFVFFTIIENVGYYFAKYYLEPTKDQKHKPLQETDFIDFGSRASSTIHAFLAGACACYYFVLKFENPGNPIFGNALEDPIFGYSPVIAILGSFSAGYFFWDSMCCLSHYAIFGFSYTLHAVFCLLSYLLKPFLVGFLPIFLFFEISTPFANAHWLLTKLGWKNSALYHINGAIFFISFFFARIIYGVLQSSYYYDRMFAAFKDGKLVSDFAAFSAFMIICNISMNLLNFYWAGKMSKHYYRILKSVTCSAKEKRY